MSSTGYTSTVGEFDKELSKRVYSDIYYEVACITYDIGSASHTQTWSNSSCIKIDIGYINSTKEMSEKCKIVEKRVF